MRIAFLGDPHGCVQHAASSSKHSTSIWPSRSVISGLPESRRPTGWRPCVCRCNPAQGDVFRLLDVRLALDGGVAILFDSDRGLKHAIAFFAIVHGGPPGPLTVVVPVSNDESHMEMRWLPVNNLAAYQLLPPSLATEIPAVLAGEAIVRSCRRAAR